MVSIDGTVVHVLFVIILCITESIATTVCPVGAFMLENLCYKHHTELKNWDDAQRYCTTVDHGHLVVVNTETLFHELQSFYINHGSNALWVGASDPHRNRRFAWVNGATCCNHWLAKEPNNAGGSEYCVELLQVGTPVGYNDLKCSNGLQFLCQTFACQDIAYCEPGYVECTGIENDHHRCTRCLPGYYPGDWGHGCQACHVDNCVAGFVQCTGPQQSDQVCSQCKSGFYWNTTLHTCKACSIDHCVAGYIQCTGPNQSDQSCLQCEAGYFWDDGRHNCQECNPIERCVQTSCTNGSISVCVNCTQHSVLLNQGTVCFDFETPDHVHCHPKCAVVFEKLATWNTAKTVCERRRGHLYVPTDGTDDRTLRNYITATIDTIHHPAFWIGGQLMTDDTVQWSHSIITSANSWVFRKPTATNEILCIALDPGEQYHWTAYNCSSKSYFVCEETTPYIPDLVG